MLVTAWPNPALPIRSQRKTARITVPDGGKPDTGAVHYCRQLERGEILFFGRPPFLLSGEDCAFLMQQSQRGSRLHKNVSYRPEEERLFGFTGTVQAQKRTENILRAYSEAVTGFVNRFLIPYAGKALRDYASFRPAEEEGRDLPVRKRNDLLHVDAFPTRPTRGGRILRVFTNIHPFRSRVWRTDAPFASLAQRYAAAAGLHEMRDSTIRTRVSGWLRAAGLRIPERSRYDRFMRQFHDFLKENAGYQGRNDGEQVEFPPMSTWVVYTDGVAHAVLSGQFALEQTFVIPVEALVSPADSPLRILERMAGEALV